MPLRPEDTGTGRAATIKALLGDRFLPATTRYDDMMWLMAEVERLQRGCTTCRFRDDEPKVFRWSDTVMTGPFCRKAGRTSRDDTPNDDDGNPIVVRCETLGNRCGAWEVADE